MYDGRLSVCQFTLWPFWSSLRIVKRAVCLLRFITVVYEIFIYFLVKSEFGVQRTTLKNYHVDNYYETFYKPVRTNRSSCRVQWFIPVCTSSPTCSSEICTDLPLASLTVAEAGKQPRLLLGHSQQFKSSAEVLSRFSSDRLRRHVQSGH